MKSHHSGVLPAGAVTLKHRDGTNTKSWRDEEIRALFVMHYKTGTERLLF